MAGASARPGKGRMIGEQNTLARLEQNFLVRQLCELGYLPAATNNESAIKAAVRAYQRRHGLADVDGWAGPRTLRAMEDARHRFCSVADVLECERNPDPERELWKWPSRRIRWAFENGTPEGFFDYLPDRETKAAFFAAFGVWSAVCGIEPEYTTIVENAEIVLCSGPVFGRDGREAAAACGCPCGCKNGEPIRLLFDELETWVVGDEPRRHEFELRRVAAHMIGHAIGIPHLDGMSLMAPVYRNAIDRPQAADIAEAVLRYGLPDDPIEPEEEPAALEVKVSIEAFGGRYEGRGVARRQAA